jgi:hypothetical protein
MLDRFTDHPHAVGETYAEHAAQAGGFGMQLVGAGLACLVHAVLPWMFEDYASRKVRALHATMSSRRAPLDLTGWVGDGLGV